MNEFQKTYNEQREKDNLNLQVQIVDKALILTLTNGKTNVVAVKNTKGNAELAYQQAFEEAVKNFYQLPEIAAPVSDVVAEMMPTEEELTKMMEKETASVENLLTPSISVPMTTKVPVVPVEETPTTSVPAPETPVIAAPLAEVPVMPVTEPVVSQESVNTVEVPEFPVMNSEMCTEMYEMPITFDVPDYPTDIPMDLPVETYTEPVMSQETVVPIAVSVADSVMMPTMSENPVQEAFNTSNPSYFDESQIGIGNPAKTLIQFGMATGKTVEECSDTELLWYVNTVQPSSKFSNLLQDIKSYLTSKGVV